MFIAVPGERAGASLASEQFRVVRVNASNDFQVDVVTAVTDEALGILQNAPDAVNKPAEVAILGTCKAKLGGTVTRGNRLTFDSSGDLVAATEITDGGAADQNVIALALQSGVSGDIIKVTLIPAGGNHAT